MDRKTLPELLPNRFESNEPAGLGLSSVGSSTLGAVRNRQFLPVFSENCRTSAAPAKLAGKPWEEKTGIYEVSCGGFLGGKSRADCWHIHC